MIIGGYLPDPPLTREQRIEAAEDRAEQAANDVRRDRAAAAWAAAANPPAGPHVDNSREQAVDTRAENRRDQYNHEYAQLMLREMDDRC